MNSYKRLWHLSTINNPRLGYAGEDDAQCFGRTILIIFIMILTIIVNKPRVLVEKETSSYSWCCSTVPFQSTEQRDRIRDAVYNNSGIPHCRWRVDRQLNIQICKIIQKVSSSAKRIRKHRRRKECPQTCYVPSCQSFSEECEWILSFMIKVKALMCRNRNMLLNFVF